MLDGARNRSERFQHLKRFRVLGDQSDQRGGLCVGLGFALFPILISAHVDAQASGHDGLRRVMAITEQASRRP